MSQQGTVCREQLPQQTRLLGTVRIEQNLHRGMIQFAVDVLSPQLPLKLTDDLFTVEDPNLFDQPIQSEPDRGVADSIFFRDSLERP